MKQHDYWLRDRIAEIPLLIGRVHLVKLPDGLDWRDAVPYVLISPSDGTDEQHRLSGPAGLMHPRYVLHTVGLEYAEVRDQAAMVKDKLIVDGFGVVPTIEGEKSHRLWYDSPTAIQRDTDTTPARLYHVAECGFPTQRI